MSDTRSPRKVLVVDDERHLVRIIKRALQNVEGGNYEYEVVEAYDGVEALEKVKAEHPNMIITDNHMPRMDGFEVLKNLQSSPATQKLPVMILLEVAQGETSDGLLFKSWASGVSSALTKPLNPREVVVFVGRIFQTLDEPTPDESVWEV